MGYTRVFAVLLVSMLCTCAADDSFCGQPKPDAAKTCISIRLPWKIEPIYFCNGNSDSRNTILSRMMAGILLKADKFKHQSPCGDLMYGQGPNTMCGNTFSNSSLLVATPWSCCPYQSEPRHAPTDVCKHVTCQDKPLNRTCFDLRNVTGSSSMSSRSRDPYYDGFESDINCCPRWFCEEGIDLQNPSCNFKLLEPSCNSPPKDKEDCVAFTDLHGCCPKFQCKGEGKPGSCPTKMAEFHGARIAMQASFSHKPRDYCVGDENCPGTQKCCTAHGSIIIAMKQNKLIPDLGYCMEPTGANKASETADTADANAEPADD